MAITIAWFGLDRTASPWNLGVADSTGAFQNFLKVPATGGGVFVPASAGGTGQTTLTANGVLIGEGTSGVNSVATATAGQLLISQTAASDPAWETASGDWTIAANGASTLATVNANTGAFGSSTAIPNFTVNAKGLVTAAGSSVVIAPAGTLTGTALAANVVNSSLTSVGIIVSGSFPAANLTGTTLAANVVNASFVTLPSLTTLANLTTVGTIGTGVWQATPVALAFGGTNAALTANVGGIFYSTSTAAAILSGTPTARQMLQSGASGPPTWSTTTWPATTTANQLLYSSATSVIGEVTTANRGVLNTSAAGVPSITPTPILGVNGGTGGTITLNGSGTGSASIGVQAAAGTPVQLNLPTTNGTSGQGLTTDGAGNTSWSTVAGSTPNPQGSLTLASGVPVMTSTVTAATSILYTPYLGDYIALWNGSSFVPTHFTEAQMTNILANSAVGNAGPSAAAANQVFDLYGWLNGSTPTLTRSDYWQAVAAFPVVTTTVTTPIASPGKVNWTNHGFSVGQAVFFTGVTLPTGITGNVQYYVIAAGLTASQFEISATVGGSAINFTGTSSGIQTGSSTIGAPTASPGILNWVNHGLAAGNGIKFSGTTPPVGLTAGTQYYVIAAGLTANQFEVSATLGGSAINFSNNAGGLWSATAPSGGPGANNGLGTITRGTQGQTRVAGLLTNTNAITNGPGAGFGTYLGSFATDASGGTVSYSLGGAASGGTAGVLNVWNMYNRTTTAAIITDSGAGYQYTTATNRQARNSASNQCTFLLGQAEDSVQASIASDVALVGAVTAIGKFGLGFDTITAFSGQPFVAKDTAAVAGEDGGSTVGAWNPGIGSHIVSSQEIGDGTNANTFDNSSLATLVVTVRN